MTPPTEPDRYHRREQRRQWFFALAGPDRSPATNWQLSALLALIAGVLNSVGFVAVAFYTSHMTGLAATVADQIVLGGARIVALGATAIVSFVLGAASCAIVFNWFRRRQLRSRYASVLAIEAVLVLVFGALADQLHWAGREWVIVPVLCFTMGLQNAIITKISAAQIRTTHITGMVTDIGIELGKFAYWQRSAGLLPVRGDRRKLVMLSSLVVCFFAGGLLGAWGFLAFGFVVLVPLALVLLIIAALPLVDDLRLGRGRSLLRHTVGRAAHERQRNRPSPNG